jgi:hypothetical protein
VPSQRKDPKENGFFFDESLKDTKKGGKCQGFPPYFMNYRYL